jgi:translation elongation factor EF-4
MVLKLAEGFKECSRISAKTGLGVDQLLERIVSDLPAPYTPPFLNTEGEITDKCVFRAYIFDSWFE